jgi:hypothetical protein
MSDRDNSRRAVTGKPSLRGLPSKDLLPWSCLFYNYALGRESNVTRLMPVPGTDSRIVKGGHRNGLSGDQRWW